MTDEESYSRVLWGLDALRRSRAPREEEEGVEPPDDEAVREALRRGIGLDGKFAPPDFPLVTAAFDAVGSTPATSRVDTCCISLIALMEVVPPRLFPAAES
jgi:hypothetical protein